MTDRLANIYAWTVNFFRLQPGDRFKVVYTEKYIKLAKNDDIQYLREMNTPESLNKILEKITNKNHRKI